MGHPAEDQPWLRQSDSNDHHQERAGTYMLVGDALGRAMVDLLSPSSQTWAINQAGPSSWSTAANWTPNTAFPNGTDAIAALTNNITTNNQINLSAPITLGQLSIGDSSGNNAFSINSGHSLTFNVGTGSATLTRTATGTSADTISPAIILADPLTVSVNNNTGSLTLSGLNTYTGDTTVTSGTLTLADNTRLKFVIGANADPDNDGIPNAVEMVLGGNPQLGMDTNLLPTISDICRLVFREFRQRQHLRSRNRHW